MHALQGERQASAVETYRSRHGCYPGRVTRHVLTCHGGHSVRADVSARMIPGRAGPHHVAAPLPP
jgi:hypothetical protein